MAGFDPFVTFGESFRIAGSIERRTCPVCDSAATARLWQLPQTRIVGGAYLSFPGRGSTDAAKQPGAYIDYVPTLQVPQDIYCYDICRDCQSIFLNPMTDDWSMWKASDRLARKFEEQGAGDYKGTADMLDARILDGSNVFVDAACGAGQVLHLMRERHPGWRLVGLELSEPCVDYAKGLGFEAHACDLDNDDLDRCVAPGVADFVAFIEAFEHVRRPVHVLRKLVRMLRPGGRLYFTSQYYSPHVKLQIRVEEPIYINAFTREKFVADLGCKVVDLVEDYLKMRVTLQKL